MITKAKKAVELGAADEVVAYYDNEVATRGCLITTTPYRNSPVTTTTGLFERAWPEIVVTGIDIDTIQQAVFDILKRGERPTVGELPADLFACKAKFIPLSDDATERFLAAARGYAITKGQAEVEALQLVFADDNGLWPDDIGCEPMSRKCQILLDRFRD